MNNQLPIFIADVLFVCAIAVLLFGQLAQKARYEKRAEKLRRDLHDTISEEGEDL